MRKSFDLSVYFVADPGVCAGRDVADVVAAALRGGVSMVQFRDKECLSPIDKNRIAPNGAALTSRDLILHNARRVGEVVRAYNNALRGAVKGDSELPGRAGYAGNNALRGAVKGDSELPGRAGYAGNNALRGAVKGDSELPGRAGYAGNEALKEAGRTYNAGLDLKEAGSAGQRCVPFLINDHVDIALEVGADGVHLGQDDMPPEEARAILGNGAIIGLTAFTEDQIRAVDPDVVDYIGTGPFYATKTDKGKKVLGAQGFKALVDVSPVPVVGIGGVTPANAAAVIEAGAQGVAMMRSVSEADDPALAARAFAV